MNKLNDVYKKMLAENGENHGNISSNYKKNLKSSLKKIFPRFVLYQASREINLRN